MSNTIYTPTDLLKYKHLGKKRFGPYFLEEWLSHIEYLDNVPKDFSNKDFIISKYPNFHSICKFVNTYIKPDGIKLYEIEYEINEKIVSRGIYKVKQRDVFNIKEFPKCEIESNKDTLTDNFAKIEKEKCDIDNVNKPLESSFKLFKSDSIRSKMQTHCIIDDIPKHKKHNPREQKYNNSSNIKLPRQPRKPLYSLVVKNIPNDMEIYEIQNELFSIFSNRGFDNKLHKDNNSVCKVNILKTSDGYPRGIAFVDFFYKESLEKIFKSCERFKLGFNILELEMKKSKR